MLLFRAYRIDAKPLNEIVRIEILVGPAFEQVPPIIAAAKAEIVLDKKGANEGVG